jgi:hypothetical protein
MQEEIKSRPSLLSSRLIHKNLKINKMYGTISLPVDFYGYETW